MRQLSALREIPCRLISLKEISHPAPSCFRSGEAEAGIRNDESVREAGDMFKLLNLFRRDYQKQLKSVCEIHPYCCFHFLFSQSMPNPIYIINQVFELQAKIKDSDLASQFERNFSRLLNLFEEEGYLIQNPTGEAYTEARTDCEASISGRLGTRMKITRTIKPIIYQQKGGVLQLLQKGVVIVENN